MVELIAVVAIVAIGAALALPDLSTFMRRSRVQSATNEFISAVNRARVEASRTGASGLGSAGTPFTVCASANSEADHVPGSPVPSCTAGAAPEAWKDGAIVFADLDGDGLRAAGEELVLSIPPAASSLTVTLRSQAVPGAADIPHVLYAPNGKLHGEVEVARFTVQPTGRPWAESRFVCLQGGGRPTELSYAQLKADPRYAGCAAVPPEVP
jgi:Tfp pilus assembly protein FimT